VEHRWETAMTGTAVTLFLYRALDWTATRLSALCFEGQIKLDGRLSCDSAGTYHRNPGG
jgi:hypothetical protein